MENFDQIIFLNLRTLVKLNIESDERPLDDVSKRLPVKFKHLRKHGRRNNR
jgi:hypothetical protein